MEEESLSPALEDLRYSEMSLVLNYIYDISIFKSYNYFNGHGRHAVFSAKFSNFAVYAKDNSDIKKSMLSIPTLKTTHKQDQT